MWRALLGAVVGMALLAAPASATGIDYPGQSAVTDPISLQAIGVATQSWRDQNLSACPDGVQTYMADSLMDTDGIDAWGRGWSCEALLARTPLHDIRTFLDLGRYEDKRWIAADECRLWTHEIGHALGLGHTNDGGVMDPSQTTPPYACAKWAKGLYPAPARRTHSAHSRHRARRH